MNSTKTMDLPHSPCIILISDRNQPAIPSSKFNSIYPDISQTHPMFRMTVEEAKNKLVTDDPQRPMVAVLILYFEAASGTLKQLLEYLRKELKNASTRVILWDPATKPVDFTWIMNSLEQNEINFYLEGPHFSPACFNATLIQALKHFHCLKKESELLSVLEEDSHKISELRKALKSAEQKSQVTTLLMGLMHDLKNALNRLAGYTQLNKMSIYKANQLFQNNQLGSENIEALFKDTILLHGQIQSNISYLFDWVNGVSLVSKDLGFKGIREIHLHDYLTQVLNSMNFDLIKSDVFWEIKGPEDLALRTQPGFLSQVIINLAGNALEHGFRGNPMPNKHLQITYRIDGTSVLLIVRNNGYPIPEEVFQNIFQESFSTRDQSSGSLSGYGLGHVKDLVEHSLQGTIFCKQDEEGYVNFEILLPIIIND